LAQHFTVQHHPVGTPDSEYAILFWEPSHEIIFIAPGRFDLKDLHNIVLHEVLLQTLNVPGALR
jgi:hypothetical protein